MEDNLHPQRISQIKNNTFPMPLFLYQNDDPEDITQAYYIGDVSDFNVMNLPDEITIVRESSAGTRTTGIYQLVSSFKSFQEEFDVQNN